MPYNFKETITNRHSFIYRYIQYCINQTDAPAEFHEFYAFSLLGIASYGIFAPKPGSKMGMQLNIYGIMLGSSAIARKSTSMDIAKTLLEDAMKYKFGESDDFTPEGLLEALERHDGRPMVVYMDEFTLLLDKMIRQFMGGIKPILLKLYANRSHTYTRTSKGTGAKKKVDEVHVKHAHLNLVGNVTPVVTERFREADLLDGFLGRFLLVAPKGKPPPMKFRATKNMHEHIDLVEHLAAVFQACQNCAAWADENHKETIEVSDDAVEMHYEFQQEIENKAESGKFSESEFTVIQRMPEHAMKFACLIALSEVDLVSLSHGPLFVTVDHMEKAITIMKKYIEYSIDFCDGMGQGYIESRITVVMNHLRKSPSNACSKRALMKKFKILKHDMDKIEATVVARGDVLPRHAIKDGMDRDKTHIEWYLVNGRPPEKDQPPVTPGMEDTTRRSAGG